MQGYEKTGVSWHLPGKKMTEGIETTFKTHLSSVSGGKCYQFDDFCMIIACQRSRPPIRVYNDLMSQRSNLKGRRDGLQYRMHYYVTDSYNFCAYTEVIKNNQESDLKNWYQSVPM